MIKNNFSSLMICTFVKCEETKHLKANQVSFSPSTWTTPLFPESHYIAQRKMTSHTQYDHQREPVKQVEDIGAKFTYKSCVLSFQERITDPKKSGINIHLIGRPRDINDGLSLLQLSN